MEKYLADTELDLNSQLPVTSHQRQSNHLRSKIHDIIIRKADKVSIITVVPRDKYIADGLQHLSDITVYTKLDTDSTPTIAAHIKPYILELYNTGYIDKIEAEYRLPPDPVQPQYINFPNKIHITPISVRPVVSGVNGATTATGVYHHI